MEESKMESFHTTQNISLIMLGLGMMVSAHATTIACNQEFKTDGEIVKANNSIVCDTTDAQNGYAILISGDDIRFSLKSNSITAGNPAPENGILITGDSNHVTGPGTVEGFFGNNIRIENASFNHVGRLQINGGGNGVYIRADSVTGQAIGNHIHHNRIQDVSLDGIFVESESGDGADGNHIYYNSIQRTGSDGIELNAENNGDSVNGNYVYNNKIQGAVNRGIEIEGEDGGSADGNHIYSNIIRESGSDGINLEGEGGGSADGNYVYHNIIQESGRNGVDLEDDSGSIDGNYIYDNSIQESNDNGIEFGGIGSGSIDGNHIYDNTIKDSALTGINVFASGSGTVNKNLIKTNHIIRSGFQAIAIRKAFSAGNEIISNIALGTQGNPVYCDNSQDNLWPLNAIGLQLVFGTPGPC